MKRTLLIVGVVVGIIVLLVVVIIPMSYSTLEYYEFGFKQRKSTGLIDRSEAYGRGGRYLLGPDYSFKPLRADAHFETFQSVSIFAKDRLQARGLLLFMASNRIFVSLTAHMQYFLRKDQMHLLHKKYDTRYQPIIYTNALNALKNRATTYTTREFIRNRTRIENDLFLGLRDMLSGPCCEKDCAETKETEAEDYKQEATIVRKETDSQIKQIENEAREIKQDATAESELIRSMAKANATATLEKARSDGLHYLYQTLAITDQKEKASLDYLRTLRSQDNVHLAVDFQQLIAGSLSDK
ncbi:hypothetical protein LSH36_107g08048 [Paralvinella palmiformis]|uniref:Band 7 domain-containing protein n=1 Tax=Paralvinella palmiformis TaxID=53620 RepID=A0AAD9JZL4_9ANNE|nr:hypothetical protein LSH36_107g08048 [Paralvinella palmiformis]